MRVSTIRTVEEMRLAAHRRMPRMVADFIDGGAEDESTVRANRSGFADVALRPTVLDGSRTRSLSTTVVGQPLSFPVMLSPAGLLRLAHADGEVGAARAAAAAGTVFTLSTGSSCTIEEVATDGPRWFQLYLWKDRDVVADLVRRARAAGYTAIVLTVDVPVVGQRERDLRNGMTLPPRPTLPNLLDAARHPAWVRDYLTGPPLTFGNFTELGQGSGTTSLGEWINGEMTDPGQSWDDLAWLREEWEGPLLVKGLVSPDDAVRAVDLGVDGIVVSNHGGRQLDGMVGAIEALPAVVDAVGERADVILDGGVRRGTDIVKALALGATAVSVGRPYVWGLGAGGATGVLRVPDILRAELDRTLALMGVRSVTDLGRQHLAVPGVST